MRVVHSMTAAARISFYTLEKTVKIYAIKRISHRMRRHAFATSNEEAALRRVSLGAAVSLLSSPNAAW